ncbi:MAG: ribbon-helix-helix protein, CopG family [Verrucomicrobiota bacterium]
MATLTIKMPAELKSKVESMARYSGKSVSAVVRESLARTVQKSGRGKPGLYELTKDLCGAGQSGCSDLATNPAHMKGFGSWHK